MEFVEDDERHALQFRVALQAAGEEALGYDLDARLWADLAVQADAVADGFADLFAEQVGHAGGGGARGDAAGFEHEDFLALGPRFVDERERHQRRLAGAGRGFEHGGPMRIKCALEFGQGGLDGEVGHEARGSYAFARRAVKNSRIRRCGNRHPSFGCYGVTIERFRHFRCYIGCYT